MWTKWTWKNQRKRNNSSSCYGPLRALSHESHNYTSLGLGIEITSHILIDSLIDFKGRIDQFVRFDVNENLCLKLAILWTFLKLAGANLRCHDVRVRLILKICSRLYETVRQWGTSTRAQHTRLCSKANAALLSSLYLHPPRELRLLMRELVYSFDKQKLKNKCLGDGFISPSGNPVWQCYR